MAKLSRIEMLKAKLAEEKQKKENGGSGGYSSDIYPFWQMAVGDQARVRILPDSNEDNPFMFYVDRLEHKISINGEDKRIPCRSMHGEDCPICELSRKYYKEEGKGSKNGKYYYRNKTSLVRVLVVEDPLAPNKDTGETYEGKVLNTQFGYQLMEKIKEQISSDDLGDFTDFNEGYDFIIKKTPQGEYGTYAVGSGFARRPSAIDEDVQSSIELIDLGTLLPKDLGYEKVHNMLSAHLSGEEYEEDGDKKEAAKPAKAAAKLAKPAVDEDDEDEVPVRKPAAKPAAKPVREEVEEEEEEEEEAPAPRKPAKPAPKQEVEEEDDEDEDIFEKLRARRNGAKK